MHKYQPRIHILKKKDATPNLPSITSLETEEFKSFIFPETTFIAVTAYQNQLVSQIRQFTTVKWLKVKENVHVFYDFNRTQHNSKIVLTHSTMETIKHWAHLCCQYYV